MDKTQLVISESFASDSEEQRQQLLQAAVDQFIRLMLKNGNLPVETQDIHPS